MLFCDTPARLKQNLPGTVLSIITSQPRRISELLAKHDGVSSIMVVGDGLHLVVHQTERMISELKEMITRAGLPFESIERVSPSVEDIFIDAVMGNMKGTER